MRTTDLIFSGVYILALLIGFTQVAALTENSGAVFTSARMFPQLVLGLGLLVGVIETARTLIQSPPPEMPDFRQVWSSAFRARRMLLLALFVVYLLAIPPLGFMGATALFSFGTMLILAPKVSPKTALIAAVVTLCTLGLIHLLLVVYLQAFLP